LPSDWQSTGNHGRAPCQAPPDGRWIHINERKTPEGGTVAVYTNITEIKQAEEELREAQAQGRARRTNCERTEAGHWKVCRRSCRSICHLRLLVQFSRPAQRRDRLDRKKLTVFFFDIVNFTATTDDLESEELTGLLNHYLRRWRRSLWSIGATIDKYSGDAILAFFRRSGDEGVKEDALACVNMAVAMQRRMRELQSEWRDAGLEKPFELRIGISTGYCTVGNFGSEDRMDYTIIGGQVNLASRLQSNAEPGSILVSHETYALVKDTILADEQEPMHAKGFAKPVRKYRVLDQLEKSADQGRVIREEQDGLRLFLDLQKLQKATAVETLKSVLSRLEG
jgi:class 3 adenylate cyclase